MGSTCRQTSIAYGQRVWKWQPDGGLIGLGTSPARMIRSRRFSITGSGIGTAESSALVYGWSGSAIELVAVGHLDDLAEVHHRDAVGDVPTTERSWAMNR